MTSLTTIKGIGEKTAQSFSALGINSVEELINFYPRDYEEFYEPVSISECMLHDGEQVTVMGRVTGQVSAIRAGRMPIVRAKISDSTGTAFVSWFNSLFLKNSIIPGQTYVFRGHVKCGKNQAQLVQPSFESPESYALKIGTISPIYHLTSGISNKLVIKAVSGALEKYPPQKEFYPLEIRRKYELPEYNYAIHNIHFPSDMDTLIFARKRLVFDEFLMFILSVRKLKKQDAGVTNSYRISPGTFSSKVKEGLPYHLTGAQEKALSDIHRDLEGNFVMNRLIQGDVGSGKTILAVLALLDVCEAGYQGAFMVPTEVLARQHMDTISDLIREFELPVTPILLTGSMTAKEKRLAYEKIADGSAQIIIGTHALIQEKVEYRNLALVITDEQHRFGVKQRETLSGKGEHPHTLVMSATPIPRTLAIIIYGDLDISVIDELPANRLPIKNCVVGTSYRPKAYQFIQREVRAGHQVYVICSMVEENEVTEAENVVDYRKKLQEALPEDIAVGLLHGKMKPKEKTKVMEQFLAGDIQVLVSTTVVEVGVNVPNATVMMVENAERFGLAQLHQLRGRVGRGKDQSYCIFISDTKSKETKERLDILAHSNDGFYIAGEDLKLRGPGDMFGIRQSGDLRFRVGDIYTDAKILEYASGAADELLSEDPDLSLEENRLLSERLNDYMKYSMDSILL